ncbi:carbohydrate sulfotransferase 4-like [Paramuricea clavata]|uniref:Carbohydrate sulfotransferase 4-like n=1 Tax=Paramuricea clavata TaxID=317549 RepID=A0A6S7IT73_PARCT|nr:carbohydrate sulfotransferase 4-like [Paramuricea clavata]
MRRNLRLTLVLLFLFILYISTSLYNGTSKLQSTAYSVSRLTDNFSVFLPITSKYRAANAKIQGRRKIHPQHARNLNIRIRPKVKIADRPNGRERPTKQRYATFVKRAKKGTSKTLDKSIKLYKKIPSASESTSGVRVIIVAHGRSGSSFFGGIFNAHPDFFFIYEPLNQLRRIVERNSEEYIDSAEYVVDAILNCNFEDDGFLEIMSRAGHHRASCRPLVSPPFCNTTHEKAMNFVTNQNWALCNETVSADDLNTVCRKHTNIASKILLESIEPVDLSWILHISGSYPVPPSSPGLQSTVRAHEIKVKPVYVLYLVRDPRAMLYSRHVLGWIIPREHNEFAFESGEADDMVKQTCDTIEQNLGAVVRHPHRIKLVRYEELATNPEGLVRKIFRELRISPSKEVFRWIYSKTHGPVKLSVLSLSRNANVSVNAWRKKIPDKLLEIIETRCERVMKYLGYLPSNGSQEILRDLRKPLYLNEIRDLKESYEWPTYM